MPSILKPLPSPVRRELADLLSGARSSPGDWSILFEVAEKEKLLGLLWRRVEGAKIEPGLAARMDEIVTAQVIRALRQNRELVRLIELLGPDVLSYKGPTLGQLAFHDSAARPALDLDLLVPAAQYEKAVATLLANGYRLAEELPRCYFQFNHEVTLIDSRTGVVVEIHRDFFWKAAPLNLAGRRTVEIAGVPVPTLPVSELFVLLCVHGTKHCWRELRWVYDLVGLERNNDIDWQEIYDIAYRTGYVRAVSIGLALAAALFAMPTPPLFHPDETTIRLAEYSLDRLAGEPSSWTRYHRYQRDSLDTVHQKLRYLLVSLFYPQQHDLAWVDLPRGLSLLYYPLRVLRIALQALRQRKV